MAKQKLTTTHEDFSKKMIKRLREKQRQGFSGWNCGGFNNFNIPKRMHDKTLNVLIKGEDCDPTDLVDIANFAMFLHRRVSA